MQLKQLELQTQLQTEIAHNTSLQNNLTQLNQQKDHARNKLEALTSYIKDSLDVTKLSTSKTVEIRILTLKKLYAHVYDSSILKNTLSYLDLSFEIAFGGLLNKIKTEIDNLTHELGAENLKSIEKAIALKAYISTEAKAMKSAEKISQLKEQHEDALVDIRNRERAYEQVNVYKQNPKTDKSIPWLHRITNGVFSTEHRVAFVNYREHMELISQAANKIELASSHASSLVNEIRKLTKELESIGLPSDLDSLIQFYDYMKNFIWNIHDAYPTIKYVDSAYDPFPSFK